MHGVKTVMVRLYPQGGRHVRAGYSGYYPIQGKGSLIDGVVASDSVVPYIEECQFITAVPFGPPAAIEFRRRRAPRDRGHGARRGSPSESVCRALPHHACLRACVHA